MVQHFHYSFHRESRPDLISRSTIGSDLVEHNGSKRMIDRRRARRLADAIDDQQARFPLQDIEIDISVGFSLRSWPPVRRFDIYHYFISLL